MAPTWDVGNVSSLMISIFDELDAFVLCSKSYNRFVMHYT